MVDPEGGGVFAGPDKVDDIDFKGCSPGFLCERGSLFAVDVDGGSDAVELGEEEAEVFAAGGHFESSSVPHDGLDVREALGVEGVGVCCDPLPLGIVEVRLVVTFGQAIVVVVVVLLVVVVVGGSVVVVVVLVVVLVDVFSNDCCCPGLLAGLVSPGSGSPPPP